MERHGRLGDEAYVWCVKGLTLLIYSCIPLKGGPFDSTTQKPLVKGKMENENGVSNFFKL